MITGYTIVQARYQYFHNELTTWLRNEFKKKSYRMLSIDIFFYVTLAGNVQHMKPVQIFRLLYIFNTVLRNNA